ncbi:MAG: PilT/PilU family type 4a pilus ATPase [Nitrospinaceae bacterium]|nr:PilT/PilU family type 4a pilus ATPase [Nitrospinaceae bacterium]NIR56480.1 PilT/PilU family type 4a pilus ATPase [Nitrospinaceae bacterium]NIS86941.1 PilT/PilU family type 4a pilus ATPase [Nitrospinaceae bacterium]NIT83779.1 PilT/PilU family type 4a pilus ATPase [Nitrospinaceae bacterium]NIU45982.1 PilT/PilU family type 4a pilus ATPase [Nitrospinaceae bacterium]
MRKAEIDHILTTMLEAYGNISDLNITVGKPLQVESSGKLTEVPTHPPIPKVTPFQAEIIALNLINSDRRLTEILIKTGSCDTSYYIQGKARFRVNIFSQRGNYSVVLRKLETRIPTIQELKLPPQFAKAAEEKNGLILVTGATGSGKSTTLAALLNKINNDKSVHVITLEDPVEFVHPHLKSTFNQRELGGDFDSFATGLRAALRQAPKVILVGEMRDRETVEIGMSAAETGHLVMSTLHTVDAGQTINRIVGMFSQEEEQQIRIRLADTLRWVISQRLVPKEGGGRQALLEIMNNNMRVKDTILNGETEDKTFYDIVREGDAYGMWTFDQHIVKLYAEGLISEEIAKAFATRKAVVARGIDNIKANKGEKTTDIEGLSMDAAYEKQAAANKKLKKKRAS